MMMFEETRREAVGLHHFASGTRRKVFICSDRREYKNLQGEVQKLEKRKANNVKKYDDEIQDWKEILKQLQNEKEGAERIQSLIETNRETFKSSVTTRRQNAIKSIRRSLAPQPTQDFPNKPTINHQLISKPPSVPRKVKIELLKREQIRLNEEKLNINETKPRKPENTNAFLDDAVAMYAKLRRQITAGPGKREVLSSAQKLKSVSSKETRPITVPGGNFKGLGTKELENSLKPRRIERSGTFGGTVPTAQWNNSPQTTGKRDHGRFNFRNMEASGLRIVDEGNAEKEQPMTNNKSIKRKKAEIVKVRENKFHNSKSKLKTNYSKNESQPEKSVNDGVVRMPKVHFVSPPDHEQDVKRIKESELKTIAEGSAMIDIGDDRQDEEEMSSRCTSDEEETGNKDNLASLNNVAPAKDKRNRPTTLSDSLTLIKIEDKHPASSQVQRLKAQGLLKSDSPRPRRDLESKPEQTFDESKASAQRFPARKHSVTGSPRRHSQPSSISTTRLSEIISEKILEQVTNAKKRLSISSNQKTSILKSYARMLQNQMKMDDVPDNDSPDFSETPFMRSKIDQHVVTNDSKANDQGIQNTAKTLSHWTLWKNQLQLGAFQSSFDYSEIEEECVLNDKERRRLSVPFFRAAGITTRKERGARLNRLGKELGEKTIVEEKGEEEEGKERNLNCLEK